MSLLVVGSIALDTVKTPFGEGREVLGGSATYFSVAASYFADKVCLVGVVGRDFPGEYIELFRRRHIDIDGLHKEDGLTFRWKGEYNYDLNEAITLDTQLNVFSTFNPSLPEAYQHCQYVFLANIDPELQYQVLDQIKNPGLTACDTMNYWIQGKLEALKKILQRIDILIVNDAETRQLAEEPNIVRAAKKILSWGPKFLIVKRGEYGALMFSNNQIFSAPGFPLEYVYDPTGAGDSFAGGFMGYLVNVDIINEANIRRAIIFGSTMASFCVEDFSLNRLNALTYPEIEKRYKAFKSLTQFEDI